jgi:formate hydrogenlyase subunit 3/multisubunit Na+/H+ antiporter MnhD subunit
MITVAVGIALCLLALSLAAAFMRGLAMASTLIYAISAGFCAVLALLGIAALLTEAEASGLRVPVGLPWLGAHLRLDALSALFLTLLGTGGAAGSFYAIGYGSHEHEPHRVLPFYPGFLGAMTLVLLADDAFTFLLSWEVMSLLSWALVLTHHREDETRGAGYLYLVMAGFGTMVLLLAFGLLAGAEGGYDFAAIREVARTPGLAALILALMMVGAGSKAGLVPLHVWLPVAHPAAPSHVSALMSGVMTKVALYGFVRVAFDLLGPVPWWMSAPVIVIGAVTAVMGILFANVDGDGKRVLAFSTIENIGVIFAALGLALAFRANGMAALAALALTAGLIHALNHMLFKSLLFMVAGAALNATGRRDLDALGGLIHRMPKTAFLALVGVTAISALPPLNGFVSEWLLFQAVLQSPNLTQPALQFLVPATGGLLALAAALAAACFVRFYGVIFLGRARRPGGGGAGGAPPGGGGGGGPDRPLAAVTGNGTSLAGVGTGRTASFGSGGALGGLGPGQRPRPSALFPPASGGPGAGRRGEDGPAGGVVAAGPGSAGNLRPPRSRARPVFGGDLSAAVVL